MIQKKVAAIIITYNPDLTILRESYTSLYKQVDKIILIDNNSTNYQELKKLFEKKEKIKIVPLSDNIGLAAAQNLGLNLAIKNNYTYAILFDQDSVLQDNGINSFFFEFEKLVSEEKLNIVAIGPSFFDEKTGRRFRPTKFIGPFLYPFRKITTKNPLTEVDFLIASGCFIKLECIKSAGMMTESLFIDYIDVEWSYRMRSYGYKLYIHNDIHMSHLVGESRVNLGLKTISLHGPLRRYYLFRNYISILKVSYIPLGYKIREGFFNIGRFLVSMIITKNRKTLILYTIKAIKDGINNEMGEYKG